MWSQYILCRGVRLYFSECGPVVPECTFGRSALFMRFCSYVLDRYRSSSRHLLCVYVFVVYYGRAALVHQRIILCVPVYCITHCTVPGIRGYVCHLLRGTCSVCTLAECYGCVALVHERVILCVLVYCATHCIVLEIRGRVCKLVL